MNDGHIPGNRDAQNPAYRRASHYFLNGNAGPEGRASGRRTPTDPSVHFVGGGACRSRMVGGGLAKPGAIGKTRAQGLKGTGMVCSRALRRFQMGFWWCFSWPAWWRSGALHWFEGDHPSAAAEASHPSPVQFRPCSHCPRCHCAVTAPLRSPTRPSGIQRRPALTDSKAMFTRLKAASASWRTNGET